MLYHILMLYGTSLFATVFLFPLSSLDAYFVASFHNFNVFITLPIVIGFEILNAFIVYKTSYKLIPLIIKKEKTKQKFKSVGEKLTKYGWWGIVVAGATPLPYSLTIYAAGAVNWGTNKQFITAIAIGRGLKYISFALALYYGWKIPLPA